MSSTLDRVAEGGSAIRPTGGEKHLPRRDGPALIKASAGTEATMQTLLWLAAGGLPLAFVVGYLIGRFLL
jgi:hypothetical protein